MLDEQRDVLRALAQRWHVERVDAERAVERLGEGTVGQQRVGVETDGRELLRADAVHQHVSGIHQPEKRGAGVGALQVQHHAALAAVDAEKDGPHAGLRAGSGPTRRVALGRLDLDDVGAVLGQVLAGVRAEHHGAQVQHAHAGEGQVLVT